MRITVDLLRPDDLLNLRLEGDNLRLDVDDPAVPALVVDDPALPAYLRVIFPPQSIAERAFFRSSLVPADPQPKPGPSDLIVAPDPPAPPGQVPARIARPSRLVFVVPPEARIPYTTAGLLDWAALELSVSGVAAVPPEPSAEQVAQAPGIAAPQEHETALELPYRLLISPGGDVRWLHRATPRSSRGRTELWHTRLAMLQRGADGERRVVELSRASAAPLRAIWSPDYQAARGRPTMDDPDLGLTAISPNDRHQIVILTSAFRGYEVKRRLGPIAGLAVADAPGVAAPDRLRLSPYVPYVPRPFFAEQLMLSPLGGWLKSRGLWDPPREARPRLGPFLLDDLLRARDGVVEQPADRLVVGPGLALDPAGREVALQLDLDLLGPIFEQAAEEREQLDLSEWRHVAAQGRDHYVRIVYEGVLWPFWNRAALIKVTEREFRRGGVGVGAYMMQRMFIVVREPERSFPLSYRGMHLKHVRLTTLVTPDIARPSYPVANPAAPADPTKNLRAFWVEVETGAPRPARFSFHVAAADSDGTTVDLDIPMMFVSIAVLDSAAQTRAAAAHYNKSDTLPLLQARSARVPGQRMRFAEPDPAAPNDNARLVTQALSFLVDPDARTTRLMTASVSLPAVQELVGQGRPLDIRLYEPYVSGGYDGGAGVFAEVAAFDPAQYRADNPLAAMVPATLGVEFSAERGGGFATPTMAVSTLTSRLGPLAGKAADAAVDAFNPDEFFKKGIAKIFGTFDLADLLRPPGGGAAAPASANAPRITARTEELAPAERRLVVSLDWEPQVESLDLGIAAFTKDRGGNLTRLLIHGTIIRPVQLDALAPPPAEGLSAVFTGTLNDFTVTVLRSVSIHFARFAFSARTGAKPEVTVALDPALPVEFTGALKFVEEIRKIIPPGLFGAGASLDITPAGIRAGFAIALPPVAVGVFALKDVSLGAALTLPILGDGKPTFDFNISERAHPFVLAVAFFGGGGFFRLQLDTAGMRALEIALEFGATASLDLGVASGGVHIMAGIYFALQRDDASGELRATLSGYLRMGGYLSVLGLIKVSVEFNLSFTYKERGKAWGRATLTVEVEVAFFSTSVELTVERQFGGSGGDPKFGELFDTEGSWGEYAAAFA